MSKCLLFEHDPVDQSAADDEFERETWCAGRACRSANRHLVDHSQDDPSMSTTATVSRNGITLPMEQIVEFCRRWKIRELAVFGSFLRDDFRPDSDLDFLYTFAADVNWTLFDLVTMDQELSSDRGTRGGLSEPLGRGAQPEPHSSPTHPQHSGAIL